MDSHTTAELMAARWMTDRERHRSARGFAVVETRCSRRQGSALLIVLVVVMILALGAYSFSEMMLSDLEATAMFGREVQARAFADSALELAASVVAYPPGVHSPNYHDNARLFHGTLMRPAETARGRGRFSIVAPVENDLSATSVRFGLMDESAKMNLNTILEFHPDESEARERLLQLPRITRNVADAILDWLDEDETPRKYGAERESYRGVSPLSEPRNGSFKSLEELLLVRGVTATSLYGEDVNRNGLLDPNENDGVESAPLDDADDVLTHGWAAYLTVHGREHNRQADGSRRINLNDKDLKRLHDLLEVAYDERTAEYVISYRQNGPYQADQPRRAPARSLGNSLMPSRAPDGEEDAEGLEGRDDQPAVREKDEDPFAIHSIYDLIGVPVMSALNSGGILASPWEDDPQLMLTYIPALEEKFTTHDGDFLEGRVNINQARLEVLLTVPGIDQQLAKAIVTRRGFGFADGRATAGIRKRSTTAWLVAEGLLDLDQMRSLAPYVTTKGDVYRVQAVGYFDAGGPVWRTEALIDATGRRPVIHSRHDLSHLGGNLTWLQLTAFGQASVE